MYRLTNRLAFEGTRRGTGSLTASRPAGTVMDAAPPKGTERTVPAVAFGLFGASVSCTASVAVPISRGTVPRRSESRTRAVRPPTLVWITLRTDCSGSSVAVADAAAFQVPVQAGRSIEGS
ncbi:hypothetical protein [Streptomyces sp. NPDC005423]|uniref:hypothetical protein n=1 Tax=Streptomyces sp. NPDC005423 TaxID=3155343 RepID=UPI0033B3CC2A